MNKRGDFLTSEVNINSSIKNKERMKHQRQDRKRGKVEERKRERVSKYIIKDLSKQLALVFIQMHLDHCLNRKYYYNSIRTSGFLIFTHYEQSLDGSSQSRISSFNR